jgi:Leucine-rich repeat (LRR) protein
MSRNCISTLVNIEQFENLCILSVSHNLIRYLDDIQPLSRLPSLKKLSLSGNVVTQMPFYKVHVLVICIHLEQLDEVKVDAVDYKLAKQMHARAKVSYDQLQVNQLRNCLLAHLSGMLACHSEMRKFVFGTFRCIFYILIQNCFKFVP